jgi:cation diffusion facilitator CzcD-associated flavoprotein CzcO
LSDSASSPEHVDVLVIGAGLSGIGAACHLTDKLPKKQFVILEARDASGGTWDLFRYPGVRSDSDMFTLGYAFRPWEGEKAIADGRSILDYVRETARDRGVDAKIRYGHRVTRAAWSTAEERWTVDAVRAGTAEITRFTCAFLFANTGYYRYDHGFSPAFPGAERFGGQIIHPQHWPASLDYSGKRIVVIGSGATAVTLVPALATEAAHVTMLQRSPSYIISLPQGDRIADALRAKLPARQAHSMIRWKNVMLATLIYQLSRRRPRLMKSLISKGVARRLPAGYDVATHFSPTYAPWDQRLCVAPNGDLFRAIREGQASVATGAIDTFTETGVRLASGEEIPADIIVTATGLNLLLFGGMRLEVDDRPVDLSKTVGYKGMMFSGVPNFAATIGYTNASWTLKADLTADYVVRLLNHMDRNEYRQAMPIAPELSQERRPIIDLTSGYIRRSLDLLPKQGSRVPWRLHQNYLRDVLMLRYGKLDDAGIVFSSGAPAREIDLRGEGFLVRSGEAEDSADNGGRSSDLGLQRSQPYGNV